MAVPEKYAHIKFTPPSGVRREAEYGLKLRREYGRGGTAVGIARARDLSNGVEVSPSTVRRMKAYFDRHASDQQADGFNRGDKSWPSNGYIAAKLWGGFESGYSWAKKVVEQMNAADEKSEGRSLRPKGSTFGEKPKVIVVYGPPGSGKSTYVNDHRGDNDVTFDFDSIMQSLSGKPSHHKNDNLISYCTDIRRLILDKSLRQSKVDTTWVVVTNPDDDFRNSLRDIPVQYVEMETPKDECLKRVSEDPLRQDVLEDTKKVIERYFENRSSRVSANIERRYLGSFSSVERADPSLLGVERRADPQTGKTRTYISGYAAKFGQNSLLLGDFVERIAPTAFEIVEKREDFDGKPLDTRCLFNHSPDHLLGRFPNTLRMWVDEVGLRYECLLPESREDLAELIERGDLLGSSFSFVVADGGERWTSENGQSVRVVTKIKSLIDVSPVTYPAYDSATVAVAKRSYQHNVVERRQKKTQKKVERRSSLSRAAIVRQEMSEFLAERRDCGREADGKFAEGNTCGGASEAPVGALGSKRPLQKAYANTGTSLESIDSAAKSLGVEFTVKESDGSVVANSKGGELGFQVSRGKEGTDVVFYSTGDPHEGGLIDATQKGAFTKWVEDGPKDYKKFSSGINKLNEKLADSYEQTARKLGASTVSADLYNESAVAVFKSRGFEVTKPPEGKWSPTTVTKKLGSKKGKRSREHRDCGREADGTFGKGNTCAGATEAGAGDSSWREGAKTGAIMGAAVGASSGNPVSFLATTAIGAAAGAIVGTGGKRGPNKALEAAYKATGTDLKKIDKAAKRLGMKATVYPKGKSVVMESGDNVATISKGEKGVSFQYQSNDGSVKPAALEKAAREVGAKTVSVEAWSDSDAKKLQSKGYRRVGGSPGGHSSSKGLWEKKLSRRSFDDLQQFLAERRDVGNERQKDEPAPAGDSKRASQVVEETLTFLRNR